MVNTTNYEIFDLQGKKIDDLKKVPVGTSLKDCFGTGFVVVNGKEEKPKNICGLGSCSSLSHTPFN